VAPNKVVEGGAHPGKVSMARRGERRRLVDVLRWRRSPVAGEGDQVLELEEGTGR
jgi:hypothetical protein